MFSLTSARSIVIKASVPSRSIISVNRVYLIGTCAKSPDTGITKSNCDVSSFPLITKSGFRDRNGELKETSQSHKIRAFAEVARNVQQKVKKSCVMEVHGRLEYDNVQGSDYADIPRASIIAESVRVFSIPGFLKQPEGEESVKSASGPNETIEFDESLFGEFKSNGSYSKPRFEKRPYENRPDRNRFSDRGQSRYGSSNQGNNSWKSRNSSGNYKDYNKNSQKPRSGVFGLEKYGNQRNIFDSIGSRKPKFSGGFENNRGANSYKSRQPSDMESKHEDQPTTPADGFTKVSEPKITKPQTSDSKTELPEAQTV